MRLLFLSFYYPPDLSAGAFRSGSLAKALGEHSSTTVDVEVLTTLPNRYDSYQVPTPLEESGGRVVVHRFPVPEHKGGFLSQSRCFAAYARAVFRHVRGSRCDAVFATSSRLMTAALGARVARLQNVPLYLDIRDIFVDTVGDVLPFGLSACVSRLFRPVESYAISRAATVNIVSPGFEQYFRSRYPYQRYGFFTNGIDPEFIAAAPQTIGPPHDGSRAVRVVYAGNIGDGQGLHRILPELANRMRGSAEFTVIGDGGRKADLERAIARQGCSNVTLMPPMSRSLLMKAYEGADVLFLHLNDYAAFAKVLPSKIFECAALGKPIWAGVGGFAARFLRDEVPNCAVFKPCDSTQGEDVFRGLQLQTIPRAEFVKAFARTSISRRMADDIVTVCFQPRCSRSFH